MRIFLLCLGVLATAAVSPGAAGAEPAGLEVMVLPTIQYAHADIWTKTPNGRGPAFAAVGQIVRQQPVHIMVSATRFATDPEGTGEVRYRLISIRPDGTRGNIQEGLRLIARGPARDPRAIHLAVDQVVWAIGHDDPLGTWRLVVEATDVIGGTTVTREQPITVCADDLLREPLPPGIEPGRWLMAYHRRPAPQQLLAAVRFTAEHPPAGLKPRRDAENGAWLGFFEQVLGDNPWLLPHVVTRLDQATGREQELLATCLAYAKRAEFSFFPTLPAQAREAFMRQRVQTWPVPTPEPLSGIQLDVLWGRFFASGRFAPIRELVAVLAYHPHREALNLYKQLKVKPPHPPAEVFKCAVFGAALMSLRSNIEQDKVVRNYCEGILLRQELPAAEHAWLTGAYEAALEKIRPAAPAGPPAAPPP